MHAGEGGKGQGGPGGQGQGGQGQGGQGGAGHGASSVEGGADDSDGRGPKYGQPDGGQGGKPVWAQEGIPEVELGRLSVIRSPDRVLDKALAEAVANFDPATMESLYQMTATAFAAYVEVNWDTVAIIDSPVENLALLKELLTTRDTSLPQVDPASTIDLAAIFIGVASDKTIPISNNTVIALATIIGATWLTDADIANIATLAEDVRIHVLEGHDS